MCVAPLAAAAALLTPLGAALPLALAAQSSRPPTRERLPPPINPGDPVPHIKVPLDGERIQVRRWTAARGSAISDPLTQVVAMRGNSMGGTGFLLKDCRVLTNLHVLMMIKKGRRLDKLDEQTMALGENLIGEVFEFQTQAIPWRDGARAVSRMVVLGHGANYTMDDKMRLSFQTSGLSEQSIGELELLQRTWSKKLEDWAIGYDLGCISEHLGLGVIRLEYGVTASVAAENDSLFTAGYPGFTMDGVSDENPFPLLYIDSKCGLTRRAIADGGLNAEIDCSVWYGASGSPLLSGPIFHPDDPDRFYTDSGRPRVAAIGMIAGGRSTPDPNVPNFYATTGAILFGDELTAKLDPYLEGPVDVEALRARAASATGRREGGSATAAMKLNVVPTYTEHAWRTGIRGQVTVEVVILRDGTVGSVRLLEGLEAGLDQRALAAARQWLFWPARRDGAPIESTRRPIVPFLPPE